MSNQEAEWLVVNSISVDEKEIVVGATNRARWDWDQEVGLSGADARTIVWVTLTDNGPGYVVSETAGLFCTRDDPLRSLAVSGIPELFEIAWSIRDRHHDSQQAYDAFLSYKLGSDILPKKGDQV